MSHPRVLHLIGSLEPGGTERQLVELIRRSSEPQRHLVAVFSTFGPLASSLPTPPVMIGPVGRGFRDVADDLRARRALRSVIRRHETDLVHAHLSMSELLAAACTPIGVPIVASRRGRNLAYEDAGWLRAAEAVAHRRVRLLLCNSEELATFTRSHDRAVPPILVIRNGVDTERFAATPVPAEPVVAVVANLIAYKRHDLFLRAFDVVSRDVPQARAVLVGEGPERERLEKLSAELGIGERVTFAGGLSDPRPVVAGARAVALTSVHEGLPNALLEAMSMGRPVVATPVGGIPELVTDDVEGFLTPPTPEAIAERLRLLLTDDEVAARMGTAARARAEAFAWETTVARTEDAYRRALAGERFPRGRRVA